MITKEKHSLVIIFFVITYFFMLELPEAQSSNNAEDNGGKTALMTAAWKNPNANAVRVLAEFWKYLKN